MGSETVDDHVEAEVTSTLKLSLFSSIPSMQSPERPGMLTPPLHTSASVPFRWEDEPGKPKTCNTLSTYSNQSNDLSHKCLGLPPRLLLMDASMTKLSSPTTVLEGPYMGRSKFQTSSFRVSTGECYGSFRRSSLSPDRDQLGDIMLRKRGQKDRGLLGSWRKRGLKGKRDVGGGSYVFPSSVDRDSDCSRDGDGDGDGDEGSSSSSDKVTRIRRAGSFSTISVAKSHFWATIYGGLKQVVPWSRKGKKDGLLI